MLEPQGLQTLKKELHAPLAGFGRKEPAVERRRANLAWLSGLDRTGLKAGFHERRVLIHETKAKEQVYLQFPGEESVRAADKCRPWDARPKVRRADGLEVPDYSFGDIWNIVFEALDGAERDTEAALATVFYRMGHMMEHAVMPAGSQFPLLDMEGEEMLGPAKVPSCPAGGFHKYAPTPGLVDILTKALPMAGAECSLEAFLHLCDLLALNEDCKYAYRDIQKQLSESGKTAAERDVRANLPLWKPQGTGRPNNLLTMVSILGVRKGDIKLTRLLDNFSRPPSGVATPKKEEILTVCAPFVHNPKTGQQILS